MKKTLLLIVFSSLLFNCSNVKELNHKWIGESKQELIKEKGYPFRIFFDDKENEIFLYADQVFINSHESGDSNLAGPCFWKLDYLYINKNGTVYQCKNEKQKIPPHSIDLEYVVSLNSETKK